MEALYRMESLCSEAFFGRCRRLVRFIENRLKLSSSKTCFIYPEYQGDPEDYLNESRSTWYVGEKRVPHNETFFELLSDANIFNNQLLTTISHGTEAGSI